MTQNESGSETRDTIISDLRRIRESLAAKFNGDLAALAADAQQRQLASGRKIIRRAKLIIEKGAATH